MGKVTHKPLLLPSEIPQGVSPIPILNTSATTQWVTVTPDLAIQWLDETNTHNRTIREHHVRRLAADMLAGKWKGQNGEAIRFDTEGRLVDGQHRLWACVQANIPFDTLLITNVEPDTYSTIGIGRPKGFADFQRGEKNVHLLGATVRMVNLWERGLLGKNNDKSAYPTIAELEVTLETHPEIRDSVNRIASMNATRKLLTASFASLIHYAATREQKTATVESFLERIGSGLGMMADDPVYQLRKFLLAQKSAKPGTRRNGQMYVLALAIKAWNASKEERAVRALIFRIDETFPTL